MIIFLYFFQTNMYFVSLFNLVKKCDSQKHKIKSVTNLTTFTVFERSWSPLHLNVLTDIFLYTNTVIFINKLCCVVWEESKGKLNWFLGYVLNISAMVKIEHLTRVSKSIDTSWQYPKYVNDVQDAGRDQILPLTVVAEWDYTDPENCILTVKNAQDIAKCFHDFADTN